jgi:hypothetical protein
MVFAFQQEKVTNDHRLKRITSPAGQQVVPRHMPLGPYKGVSSKGSGLVFCLFFKGFQSIHEQDITPFQHPVQQGSQGNSTSTTPIKGVSRMKFFFFIKMTCARFS